MKKLAFAALVLAALLVVPAVLAADSQTLEGEFVWEREDENIAGPVKAVFEPTGDNTWDVAFYFNFDDTDHVYKGTAEGSLTEGELKGEVMGDQEQQYPYEFTGTFDAEGHFSGTHAFLSEEGEARHTGTITLGR